MNTTDSGHSAFKYYSSAVPKQAEWIEKPISEDIPGADTADAVKKKFFIKITI